MNWKEIKVGVLGGGVSGERDISLLSARHVYQALCEKRTNAVFIDIITKEREIVKNIISIQNIDLAFIALHGEFGEDGQIQEILEELGITYIGSGPKASLLAMDKILSKTIFKEKGVKTPDFIVGLSSEDPLTKVKFPVVVKPYSSGSSLGISIVRQESELSGAIDRALLYQNKVIIEEFIDGKELTIGILADQPLAVVEIISRTNHFDFNAKYHELETKFIVPAKLPGDIYKEVQRQALAAHKALGCRNFSRVDIRLSKDNIPYILEVNSIPGLTSHSLLPLSAKACGIDFNDLVLKMGDLSLYGKKKTQKNQTV